MRKFYSVNELCRLTDVSPRTLHYYDEINLLKSFSRSKAGHRLYSEEDMVRLQQIMTLKYIGFSLAQIKKMLQDHHFNIFSSLKNQTQVLKEEVNRIQKATTVANYLMNQHKLDKKIEWDVMSKMIMTLKLKESTPKSWYDLFLTPSELQVLKQFEKKRTQKWQRLFNALKKIIYSDPESIQAKQLVAKCLRLVNVAYGKHPKLRNKLWEGYQAGIITDFPYDEKVVSYLSNIIKINNISN